MRECVIHDAMGQRIAKTVTNKNVTTGDKFVTTYYVRDPQGKVLAVYEHKRCESGKGIFTLAEQHLYGASRLGMTKPNLVLSGTGTGSADPTAPAVHYELTNHLGNVLSVITPDASDAKQPAIKYVTDGHVIRNARSEWEKGPLTLFILPYK